MQHFQGFLCGGCRHGDHLHPLRVGVHHDQEYRAKNWTCEINMDSLPSGHNHGCNKAVGGLFRTLWQDWQSQTICSMCLSIKGHQTCVCASDFIFTISGWLVCSSISTGFRQDSGTITLIPQQQTSCFDSELLSSICIWFQLSINTGWPTSLRIHHNFRKHRVSVCRLSTGGVQSE